MFCSHLALSLQKIGGLGIKLLPLQGVNAMSIRNPGCCPGLGAVALSGRAIAFSLHDKLSALLAAPQQLYQSTAK